MMPVASLTFIYLLQNYYSLILPLLDSFVSIDDFTDIFTDSTSKELSLLVSFYIR